MEIDLNDLDVRESEKNTTAALIRGVAAAFVRRGYKLSGFEAKVRSTVLPGSGLSSSAAFEVLIGRILNGLFAAGAVSAIEIAQDVYKRQSSLTEEEVEHLFRIINMLRDRGMGIIYISHKDVYKRQSCGRPPAALWAPKCWRA